MKLDELRSTIAALDDQILDLIKRRLEAAEEIGSIKSNAQVPIRDFPVEARVLERMQHGCKDRGVDTELGRDLARLLIDHSVMLQTSYRDLSLKRGSGELLVVGGLGKMGRWFCSYFHAAGYHVRALDPAAGESEFEIVEDFETAASRSDIIVLAVPIDAVPGFLRSLDSARVSALILDIASLKTPIMGDLRVAAARGLRVASIHPMFGPDAVHLIGRNLVFCDCGDKDALAQARHLFEDVGANLVELTLEEHDRYISYVLGLAHLINILYAHVLAGSGLDFEALGKVASTTFAKQNATALDVVRENPDLYFEIQHQNAAGPELGRRLSEALPTILSAIGRGDRKAFRRIMEGGRSFFLGPAERS